MGFGSFISGLAPQQQCKICVLNVSALLMTQDRKIMRLAIIKDSKFSSSFDVQSCSTSALLSIHVFPEAPAKVVFSTELLPNFNFLLNLHNIYYVFYITYIIYIYIIKPLHGLYQLLLHHTSHTSSASCPSNLSTSLSHTSASSTSHAYMTYIMHTRSYTRVVIAVVMQQLLHRSC